MSNMVDLDKFGMTLDELEEGASQYCKLTGKTPRYSYLKFASLHESAVLFDGFDDDEYLVVPREYFVDRATFTAGYYAKLIEEGRRKLENDKQAAEALKTAADDRERQEYERLKQKFEPPYQPPQGNGLCPVCHRPSHSYDCR